MAAASIALLLDRVSGELSLPENLSIPVGKVVTRDSVRRIPLEETV